MAVNFDKSEPGPIQSRFFHLEPIPLHFAKAGKDLGFGANYSTIIYHFS